MAQATSYNLMMMLVLLKLIASKCMKYFHWNFLLLFSLVLVFVACSPKPFAATNKIYSSRAKAMAKTISSKPDKAISDSLVASQEWVGTTNFGLRKPNYVIIHHTAQNSCEKTLLTFTRDSTQVSAHYVICKDGTLHQMLNDYLRAWHAGASKWGNTTDLNSSSIGIELDNNGIDTFSEGQLKTLELLLAALKIKYNIPTANFIAHADIAPGRKIDPNINFPWKRFAESGYGLWYADTTNMNLPQNFDAFTALRIIGYNISNPAAAVQVFRQHFLQSNATGELTEPEKKVLYGVLLNTK